MAPAAAAAAFLACVADGNAWANLGGAGGGGGAAGGDPPPKLKVVSGQWLPLGPSFQYKVRDGKRCKRLSVPNLQTYVRRPMVFKVQFPILVCTDGSNKKLCSKCSRSMPVNAFNVVRKVANGRAAECSDCYNTAMRARYHANLEREKARSLSYRMADRLRREAERDAHYKANKEQIEAEKAALAVARKQRERATKARQRAKDREKRKESARKYRQEKREELRKKHAAYRAKKADQIKQSAAAYRALKREQIRASAAAYRAKNPEIRRANKHKRRAALVSAKGSHTAQDIRDLAKLQKHLCAHPWCKASIKVKYHVDHRIPLAKSGSNGRENLQLLCVSCNLAKGAKHPIEYAQLNGMLL